MMRRMLKWGIACLLVLMTGCMVSQSHDVKTYRRVLDGADNLQIPPYDPKETLTLKRTLALANAQNEQLAIAGENYLQSLIDKDRAFANFLPTINFVPTYMYQAKSNIDPGNPLISQFLRTRYRDLPAKASMNVNPFQDVPIMNAAEYESKRQQAILLDQKAVTLLDAARTYYQVLQSECQLNTIKHSIAVGDQRVKDFKIQEKAGVVSSVDVAQAAAGQASSQNAMILAQNDISHGRSMLALLVGLSDVEAPLSDSFKAPQTKFEMKRLLTAASEHRPELQAAHAQVEVAARVLESAWAEYFPSVSLNLTYFLSRQSFPSDVDWTSLIEVHVPIFSAGLAHADVRTAYSRLRQAKLAESYALNQMTSDLNVIMADLNNDNNRIDQTLIQVNASRESLRKAEVAYKAGAGTYLELLIARENLSKKELTLTEAQFKRNIDYLKLKRAIGVLDTDPDAPIPESPVAENTAPDNQKTPMK